MIVAITGTMCAGKTTVAKYLEEQGYSVIYSDNIARELSRPGKIIFQKLLEHYGNRVLNEDGELDRKKLAQIAFKDQQSTEELDRLTHPFIVQEIFHSAKHMEEQARGGTIFVEVPLLIESGFDLLCQKVWFISAADDVKLARAIAAGMGESDAKRRLGVQRPETEYLSRADLVTENNGSLDELKEDLKKTLEAEFTRH